MAGNGKTPEPVDPIVLHAVSVKLSPFWVAGDKRERRQEIISSLPVATLKPASLLYVEDSLSKRGFLVDSTALQPATANGSAIRTWGEITVPHRLGSRHFSWRFQLATVDQPILGDDF